MICARIPWGLRTFSRATNRKCIGRGAALRLAGLEQSVFSHCGVRSVRVAFALQTKSRETRVGLARFAGERSVKMAAGVKLQIMFRGGDRHDTATDRIFETRSKLRGIIRAI